MRMGIFCNDHEAYEDGGGGGDHFCHRFNFWIVSDEDWIRCTKCEYNILHNEQVVDLD